MPYIVANILLAVSFVGSTLIVKNSEDLKKGDEVFNCYGKWRLFMLALQ